VILTKDTATEPFRPFPTTPASGRSLALVKTGVQVRIRPGKPTSNELNFLDR
jgi:hypothetical protein